MRGALTWFSALELENRFHRRRSRSEKEKHLRSAVLSQRSWACALKSLHSWSVRDTVYWNSVLSALDRNYRWNPALMIASWMSRQHVKADLCTINTAAGACARQGDWLRVTALLRGTLRREMRTDSVSFGIIVNSCANTAQWQQASGMLMLADIVSAHSNDVMRSAAVHSCLRGAWPRALQLAGRIRSSASGFRGVVNSLMGICQKSSCWELPMNLLRRLYQPQPRSYTVAISATGGSETEWTFATSLLKHMQECNILPDAVSINACIASVEIGSAWDAALGMIQHAQATGLCLDLPAVVMQMTALSRSSRWPAALAVSKDSSSRRCLVVFNALMAACQRGHSWSSSLSLLRCSGIFMLKMDEIGRSSVITACSAARWDSVQLFTPIRMLLGVLKTTGPSNTMKYLKYV